MEHTEKHGTHTLKFRCQCKSCGGTGLYSGMGEAKDVGVVCHTCKGKGFYDETVRWKDFEGRLLRENTKWVIQTNPGISVGQNKERGIEFEDFGGMKYEDWWDNKDFPPKSEMRKYTCPAWWYQSADSDKKPKWDECLGCGRFDNCDHFATKEKCWERFDKEQESQ